jgi:hypothetical protein
MDDERRDVRPVWECPECLFAFAAEHTDTDGGGHSCPVCELAAASRYAPIRVEAGGMEGWVQPLGETVDGEQWWVGYHDRLVQPLTYTPGMIQRMTSLTDAVGRPESSAWWSAAAAAVASWVAGGTD